MTEIAEKATFSLIRYAQCWEDADILLDALEPQRGGLYVSIASAGDNSLSLLSRSPDKVIALDMNPTQLACLELRVAAYKALTHSELLQLMGSEASTQRSSLYKKCRSILGADARRYWDSQSTKIEYGIGSAGKFENYFSLFRNKIIPLIHNKNRVQQLLLGGAKADRQAFYDQHWNTWRWRALFKIFFSRFVMGRLGRDPSFFNYVDGSVSDRILQRAEYALTQLDPSKNPYLQWILTGSHQSALPHALRKENFESIRENIDRIEWRLASIEEFLARAGKNAISGFNLSDIFEYMSDKNFKIILEKILHSSIQGARLAYWNMLVPRSAPSTFSNRIQSLDKLSAELFAKDKAFFYSAFIVEEVL